MYCHPTVAKPHEWLLWESTVRCEPVRFIQTNALIGNVKLVQPRQLPQCLLHCRRRYANRQLLLWQQWSLSELTDWSAMSEGNKFTSDTTGDTADKHIAISFLAKAAPYNLSKVMMLFLSFSLSHFFFFFFFLLLPLTRIQKHPMWSMKSSNICSKQFLHLPENTLRYDTSH